MKTFNIFLLLGLMANTNSYSAMSPAEYKFKDRDSFMEDMLVMLDSPNWQDRLAAGKIIEFHERSRNTNQTLIRDISLKRKLLEVADKECFFRDGYIRALINQGKTQNEAGQQFLKDYVDYNLSGLFGSVFNYLDINTIPTLLQCGTQVGDAGDYARYLMFGKDSIHVLIHQAEVGNDSQKGAAFGILSTWVEKSYLAAKTGKDLNFILTDEEFKEIENIFLNSINRDDYHIVPGLVHLFQVERDMEMKKTLKGEIKRLISNKQDSNNEEASIGAFAEIADAADLEFFENIAKSSNYLDPYVAAKIKRGTYIKAPDTTEYPNRYAAKKAIDKIKKKSGK